MDDAPTRDQSDGRIHDTADFASDFESQVIRITVDSGKNLKDYYIHRQLLFQKLTYFAAMTNFKEGNEYHIVLKDIDHDAFGHICHWMYYDTLDPDLEYDFRALICTWIAADRLLLSECKNKAIDRLRMNYDDIASANESIKFAASFGFDKEHPLTRCLIDQISWDCVYDPWDLVGFFGDLSDGLPKDIMMAIMTKFCEEARELKQREEAGRPRKRVPPFARKGCLYHEHIAGEVCYTKTANARGGD